MSNVEQKDELEVLHSMYGEDVMIIDENKCDGSFMVHPVLPQPFTIVLYPEGKAKRELQVGFLPPIVLHFRLPSNYPSKNAPQFVLSCQWLTRAQLICLCKHLDKLWMDTKPEVVMYHWIQFLQEDALAHLNLTSHLDITELATPTTRNFGNLAQALIKMRFLATSEGSVEEICQSEKVEPEKSTSRKGSRTKPTIDIINQQLSQRSRLAQNEQQEVPAATHRSKGRGRAPKPTPPTQPFQSSNETTLNDEQVLKNLKITSSYSHPENRVQPSDDPRAVVDLKQDASPLPIIVEFNEIKQKEIFDKQWFSCKVCLTENVGSQCLQFVGCHHVFCKRCMKIYFEVQIKEGNVQLLTCPEEKCSSQATQSQVYQLVEPELFDRYDRMLLEMSFATMGDFTYCPRPSCQFIVYRDLSESYAMCDRCDHAFCLLCRKTYHGVAPCTLPHEEKFQIIKDYRTGSPDVKQQMEKRYGKKQLTSMIDEAMSEQWVKDCTKKCPRCSASIQKIDGCNKMMCWRCNTFFCWLCMSKLDPASPYVHFNQENSKCFNLLFEGTHDVEDDEDWEFGQFI